MQMTVQLIRQEVVYSLASHLSLRIKESCLYADAFWLEEKDPAAVYAICSVHEGEKRADTEGLESQILLEKAMAGGQRCGKDYSVEERADFVQQRLQQLADRCKALEGAEDFPVGVSGKMLELRRKCIAEAQSKYHGDQ